MRRGLTPSQTVGPFFHPALLHEGWNDLTARGAAGERVVIEGKVVDGAGAPVNDAMIEVWQANAAGRYDHPEDRQERPADPNFHGFGRVGTSKDGSFRFRTIKPGPVPGHGDAVQAPHLNLTIFARGLLKQLLTRIYFPDEPLNSGDPILSALSPDARATLIARPAGRGGAERTLRFDIVLQGKDETVFLEV